MEDSRTDAELLSQLRDGDQSAYVALWERHVGAALRYANRTYRSRADDLVSESFLAIYQQVTTTGKGPEFAFFSYLKAVMRNTAIRWRKEANRLDDTVEADSVDFRDALSLVEREANANELLSAFQELPERWQRVLWLAEVADVARPTIAQELGIKPNAVSALHRRAKSGLKLQWLAKQVPAQLREDESHAARLFPRYLTDPEEIALADQVSTHIAVCAACDDLLISMRTDARRLQGATLSAVGFGALGVAIPSASALAPGTAAAAALLAGGGIGLAGLLAGGVGVLTVGGILLASFFTANPTQTVPPASAAEAPAVVASAPPTAAQPTPVETPTTPVATTPPDDPSTSLDTGRRNTNPSIDDLDLVDDPDSYVPPPTTRPPTAPVDTPGPSDEETELTPGVTTPVDSSGYLPPAIAGDTRPGSSVAVDLDGTRYAPPVAADGTWTFDARNLNLDPGVHEYQVWAFDATTQSAATTGTITITPVEIGGFEQITGFEDMLAEEASTTGLVVSFTGPANGQIRVASMQGHSATVTLDDTGHALKRLRLNSWGWYWLEFYAVDAEGYEGPRFGTSLDVYDPDVVWTPWGPPPEDMTFEFTDE